MVCVFPKLCGMKASN